MSMSTKLTSYLTSNQIPFQSVAHQHSHSSFGSAISAHVPAKQIAKAVLLEDHQGRHMLAVLPANNKLSLAKLNDELQASFRLVKEQQVYKLFDDCDPGAVPPIGEAYHLNTVYDELLELEPNVYIEAGDHETLLRLSHQAFSQAMKSGKQLRFSREVFH
jgi:Ala-tRNA(Pro) deacylase